MGCSAGYPDAPCPFNAGFKARCTRRNCGPCKNYIPPRHILTWCARWDREKYLCHLPLKACATCPHKVLLPPGGQPGEGMDKQDPRSVRAYEKRYRDTHPEQVEAKAERFKNNHPDYFKSYYLRNKLKILARIAERRAERKRAKMREQGSQEV